LISGRHKLAVVAQLADIRKLSVPFPVVIGVDDVADAEYCKARVLLLMNVDKLF
jgi:hypothetical protein